MKLREWRRENGLTQKKLAQALGCTQSTISTFERERNPALPAPELMTRLYLATGGRVQPNDFYDLPLLAAA